MDTFQFNAYDLPTLEEVGTSGYTAVPSNQTISRVVEKKKRKLDLVKCERCRLDRQKCNPVSRIWPTKCDRCVSRGFPCSEGKRAERMNKHAALLSKTLKASTSPENLDNEEEDFKNNLKKWNIALSCAKIVEKALAELSTLKKASIKPFMDKWTEENEHKYKNAFRYTVAETLEYLPGELARYMKIYQKAMLENGSISRESLLSAVSAFTDQSLLNLPDENDTRLWDHHWNEYLQALVCRGDIGSEFLFRQRILQIELRKLNRGRGGLTLWEEGEANKLHSLRERILEEANLILGDLDMRLKGLYNPPETTLNMLAYSAHNLLDCLERTPLLQWMDATSNVFGYDNIHTMSFHLVRESVNRRDKLHRTLLHVACQRGWEEGVEALLRNGADTHITTLWGHAPLHYAAAIGSSKICQMLIDYDVSRSTTEKRFQVDYGKDCQKNTALYYAVGSKDIATVKVLLASHVYGNPHVRDEQACPPPLIRAIFDDEFEIASLIAKSGADPMITFQGQTAFKHSRTRAAQSRDPWKWNGLMEEMRSSQSLTDFFQSSKYTTS